MQIRSVKRVHSELQRVQGGFCEADRNFGSGSLFGCLMLKMTITGIKIYNVQVELHGRCSVNRCRFDRCQCGY